MAGLTEGLQFTRPELHLVSLVGFYVVCHSSQSDPTEGLAATAQRFIPEEFPPDLPP